MRRILLIICIAIATCFAEKKCEAYQQAYAERTLLSLNWDALYPMLSFCFWEGFANSLEPSYKEFDWNTARKKLDGLPTDKGLQLFEKIHQSNEVVIKEFIRSGKFSNGKVIPCFLTEDMLDAMGTFIWNRNKKAVLESGISPDIINWVFLDKNVCTEWKSHKTTDQEMGKEMVDPRDGQTYKTVKINGDIWMAENLNYKTKKSRCYNNKASNCKKYGQLYDIDESQTVCPTGWKLPIRSDMRNLYSKGDEKPYSMQAKGQKKWPNATDDFGFSALATGFFAQGKFFEQGSVTGFWLERECDGCSISTWVMSSDKGYTSSGDKDFSFSVRCIKDAFADNTNEQASSTESPKIRKNEIQAPPESTTIPQAPKYTNKGSLTDPRDGQKYKTVTIDGQTWMAENLNYKTKDSYCYGNDEAKCSKYKRLYTYNDALTACPDGWHLPDKEEFNRLIITAGGKRKAGRELKASGSWTPKYDWQKDTDDGSDDYGFSALPAGMMMASVSPGPAFMFVDEHAYFWASSKMITQWGRTIAARIDLKVGSKWIDLSSGESLDDGYSVRCIKGPAPTSTQGIMQPNGKMKDLRDGNEYRTTQYSRWIYMTENMRYDFGHNFCKPDDPSCKKYGRYYDEDAAKSACPAGWRTAGYSDPIDLFTLKKIAEEYNFNTAPDFDAKLKMFMQTNSKKRLNSDVLNEIQFEPNLIKLLSNEKWYLEQANEVAQEMFASTSGVYDLKSNSFTDGNEICQGNVCANKYDRCIIYGNIRCYNALNPRAIKGIDAEHLAAPVRCYKELIDEEFSPTTTKSKPQKAKASAPPEPTKATAKEKKQPVPIQAKAAPTSTHENSTTPETSTETELENDAADLKPAPKQRQASAAAKSAKEKANDNGKKIKWPPIICAGLAITGGALAYVFDQKASDATAIPPTNTEEYKKGYNESGKNQTYRNISIGFAAASLVAFGITFLF